MASDHVSTLPRAAAGVAGRAAPPARLMTPFRLALAESVAGRRRRHTEGAAAVAPARAAGN